jgi:hypothetical protein
MVLPLSGDAVLILLGLATYLATCLLSRHPLTWGWALVPGVCLAILLEAWEIWDHYGQAGLAELGRLGFFSVVARHSRDVLVMNLAPLAVFLAAHAVARIARG